MPNLSSLIKSIRDIMREDRGLSGVPLPLSLPKANRNATREVTAGCYTMAGFLR